MITVQALSHRHTPDSPPVLHEVDLEVPRGQTLALLGRSGSGKSTLLNLLAGIEVVQHGRVEVAGTALHGGDDDARTLLRRRQIGFIYQFFNLVPTLTAAENLALPLQLNGLGEQRELVDSWLARTELDARAQAFPDSLSGGEQQRLAIARALIHRPALVLADEPTGNLDARSGELALELLLAGAREQSQTLLVVTHSRAVAERCERVVSLVDGELRAGQLDVAW